MTEFWVRESANILSSLGTWICKLIEFGTNISQIFSFNRLICKDLVIWAESYQISSFNRLICKDLEIWGESYQGVRCSGLDTEMCLGLDLGSISVTRTVICDTRNSIFVTRNVFCDTRIVISVTKNLISVTKL